MEIPRGYVLDQCESSEGPKLELLQRIADEFEITFDDLIDGKFDREWIAHPSLDQKYVADTGSKLRSSLPVIRWLEENYGAASSHSLLRSLRIPSSAIRNPDQPVKLKLLYQLIQAARARGVSPEGIFDMGRSVFHLPENEPIRATLVKYKKPREIFECFFTEMLGKFERNYTYAIQRADHHSLRVMVRPHEERIIENGANVVLDRDLSIYRWGVGAGTLALSEFEVSQVQPITKFNIRNPSEIFEISWRPRTQAALGRDESSSTLSHLRLL